MNLDPECLDVTGSVGSAGEIGEVELDLVPTLVQTHRHRANKWFHSRCALYIISINLVVGCPESTFYVFVVQNLNFESKVLLQLAIIIIVRFLLSSPGKAV